MTTALGCISKAEERLRAMLAACGPLQQWLGVAGAAEALAKIHLVELPPSSNANFEQDGNYQLSEIQSRRPFVIVWTPPDQPFMLDILAAPAFANHSGVLRARLEENVPADLSADYPTAYRRFLNSVGRILQSNDTHNPGLVELLAQQQPDHLPFRSISVVDHMRTTSDDVPTMGDAHKCELEFRWGMNT
jgi:hypothetical protein